MSLTWILLAQGGNEGDEEEDKERPLPLLPALKALHAAWLAASPNRISLLSHTKAAWSPDATTFTWAFPA